MRHLISLFFVAGMFLGTQTSFAQDEAPAAEPVSEEVASGEAPEAATEEAPEAEEEPPPVEEVEETLEDAADLAGDVAYAIHSQNWAVAVGLLLIIVVFLLRKAGVEGKLPQGSKALPWLTLSLATAASVGAALLGQMEWSAVLGATLGSAGIAMGGWDLTKLFRKQASEEPIAAEE